VYLEADRMGLVINPRIFYDHVTMSAHLWPHASVDSLTALVYFNTIGYYLNDTISRDIQIMADAEASRVRVEVAHTAEQVLIRGAEADPDDKYGQAFARFRALLSELVPSDFLDRFFSVLLVHWRDVTITYNKSGFDDVNLEDFITLRRSTSGMMPTIMLTEVAQNVFMPEGTLDLVPGLGGAITALADIGGLSNELWSYTKEVTLGGARFNLVPVLEREYNIDTDHAILAAMDIVNDCFDRFETAMELVDAEVAGLQGNHRKIKRFLTGFLPGLWDIAAACYHWQMETNRYRSELNPFPDLRSQIPYNDILPSSQGH
jgi:hypothetical protein